MARANVNPGDFPKGVSGNPGGRTKEMREREKRLSEAIRKLGGDDGIKYVARLHQIAMDAEDKESIAAIKVLFERGWGKCPDFLHVDGGGVDPTTLAVIEAIRMTPHERRAALAQDTTGPEPTQADDGDAADL